MPTGTGQPSTARRAQPSARRARLDFPVGVRCSARLSPRLGTVRRPLRTSLLLCTLPLTVALCTTTCSPRDVDRDTLSRRGELQYRWARVHLRGSFAGYGLDDDLGVSAFDVILLSNLASGLMNVAQLTGDRDQELAELGSEVARRALSEHVAPRSFREGRHLGDHNLYGSHLLLTLAIEHHLLVRAGDLDANPEHDRIADRVARALRAASLSHPSGHARSYPGSARWPADQSVTLAALDLYDREHGTALAAEPIARWLRWMAAHQTNDLPHSETGTLSYAAIPRGCALSFLSIYVSRFLPEEGARIYARYRAAHGIDWLGWRGFREWPEDVDGGSDVDAGPVIFGWGTAATGIGLGAARLMNDRAMAAGIERIADTVGMSLPLSGRYLLAPTLGQAMLFSGETATTWDERVPPSDVATESTGWPVGPALLWLALTLLQLLLARPMLWRR